MKSVSKAILSALLLIGALSCTDSDQLPDPDFAPQNTKSTFSTLNSPVVFIDEAHNNFLTKNGRFKPFSQVLSSDGYTVKSSKEKFTLTYLKQADILVVANALDRDRQNWSPPFGDAFDQEEIKAIKQWVSQGGSLFLVADHTPFPKVIEKISFGFEFSNGHVRDALFRQDNKSLLQHSITKGITQVKTFGGSAFQIPENAQPLLILGKGATSVVPEIPFLVNAKTPRISVDGWYQGAVLEVGKGRVAVFAEGMMFSSQVTVSTGKKYGLVSDGAEQNEQFLLNIMHWLSKPI
ncbi:MAG: DUF4350 domain-containing protein [Paraglaciecola sp.]|uniref:DUF4350 domain-containing protein n=1 Tax=Paraglaciecola sp. TaxID=1920173 RepID=UPI003297FC55